jgi:hypothetical protein
MAPWLPEVGLDGGVRCGDGWEDPAAKLLEGHFVTLECAAHWGQPPPVDAEENFVVHQICSTPDHITNCPLLTPL